MVTYSTDGSYDWPGRDVVYGRLNGITELDMATEAMARWKPIGLQFIRAWAAKPRNKGQYVIADKIIMDSRVYGIEQPSDVHYWGPVFQAAADEGVIRLVSSNGKAPHRRFAKTAVWVAD